MAKKYLVALDDGHGMETAGKRTPPIPELDGRVIRENEFNKAVKHFLADELKRCGFEVLFVAPGDKDVPLATRTNLANSKNADIYVSIHYNAFDGKFDDYDPEGLSVHIYPGSKEGRKLAECIIKYLKNGTPQRNRGIVENNFHVLRETKMPAILSENGFMDNKREALLMINVDFQKEVAKEHAQGICEYFGVKYIPEDNPEVDVFYRVQVGAFKYKKNADALAKMLTKDKFDTYIIKADGYYKVQTGAFRQKKNATSLADKLRKLGHSTYITTKSGAPVTQKDTDMDLDRIAIDVINGKLGNGQERKARVEAQGYNYDEVQKIVNQIMYKGSTKPKETLKVGSRVKVRQGAKDYNGKGLASSVYRNVYDVIQINGDRIVIGKGKTVTAAVNKKELIIV